MVPNTNSNNKVITIGTVEGQILFLAALLSDVYGSVVATEGLDEDGAEVKVNVIQNDLFPVILASGSRSYRRIVRVSVPMTSACQYSAAQWSAVSGNGFGSDNPPAAITGIANGT
jgi:hypothetical protein